MSLAKSALADLRKSGLNDETIEHMGVYSVLRKKEEWMKKHGIYKKIDGQHIAQMTDFYAIPYQQGFMRVKLENEVDDRKYLQPMGQSCRLYYMKGEDAKFRKKKCPIIFTEGEKKTAKLWQELDEKYLAIGCCGISTWQKCVDWKNITLNGRDVWIAFDRPPHRHPELEDQLLALFFFLVKKGANPYFLIYPDEKVDDWLAIQPNPKEALREAIKKSKAFDNVFDIVENPRSNYLMRKLTEFKYDKHDIAVCWDKYDIAKKAKMNKGTAKAMLKKQYIRNLQEKYEEVDWLEVDENGQRKVTPGRLAKTMLEKYSDGIAFFRGEFWTYDKATGTWFVEPENGRRILKKIQEELGDDLCRKRIVDDVFSQMKNYAVPEDLEFRFNMYRNFLNLKNGVLNLEDMTLGAHSKDYYFTSKISTSYEPMAECHRWKKFLEETELDSSTIDRIQEWFGYCLVPETRMQRALFLVGPGGNGKSVILETLGKLLQEYCTSFDIGELFNRFNLVQTENMLVNICADCNSAIPVNERIKAFLNGEDMQGEKKGKDSYPFSPFARLVFAANDFLTTKDRSHGFYRKFDVIEMTRIFKEHEQDRNLKYDIWENELPGILIWAIEGLKRLRKEWKFTESEEINEGVKKFKVESNPMLQFLNECCEVDEKMTEYIETKTLYDAYVSWCVDTSHMSFSSTKFGRELKKTVNFVQRKRITSPCGEKRPWVYKGVRLLKKGGEYYSESDIARMEVKPRSKDDNKQPKGEDKPKQTAPVAAPVAAPVEEEILAPYLAKGYDKHEDSRDGYGNIFMFYYKDDVHFHQGWTTEENMARDAKSAFEKNERKLLEKKRKDALTVQPKKDIQEQATTEHSLFDEYTKKDKKGV